MNKQLIRYRNYRTIEIKILDEIISLLEYEGVSDVALTLQGKILFSLESDGERIPAELVVYESFLRPDTISLKLEHIPDSYIVLNIGDNPEEINFNFPKLKPFSIFMKKLALHMKDIRFQ